MTSSIRLQARFVMNDMYTFVNTMIALGFLFGIIGAVVKKT
jgi:hypothetical protein